MVIITRSEVVVIGHSDIGDNFTGRSAKRAAGLARYSTVQQGRRQAPLVHKNILATRTHYYISTYIYLLILARILIHLV